MAIYDITADIISPAVLSAGFGCDILLINPSAVPDTELVVAPVVFGGAVNFSLNMRAQIVISAVFGGVVGGTASFTAAIVRPAVLSASFLSAAVISATITPFVEMNGSFDLVEAEAASKESTYERTGYRKSVPVLVYALETLVPADIADVPIDRSFLVAAAFAGGPGDDFFDLEGAPNYIGTKMKATNGIEYIVFRPPEEFEVIWMVPTEKLYRYEPNRDTGVFSWKLYRSLPERALEGQAVFDVLDPDSVYRYYGKLWGALMSEWTYDDEVMARQVDPDKVSHFFIPSLAAQFGLELDADDPVQVQRSKTRNAVETFKFKGMDRGVEIRLRDLGYHGYAREVWINPGDPTLKLVADAIGSAHNVAITTSSDLITVFGMSDGDTTRAATGTIAFRRRATAVEGDLITISDGTNTVVFEFDANASVTPGHVAVVAGASPGGTLENLRVAINASVLTVTATTITIATTFGPPIRDQATSSPIDGTLAPANPSEILEYPHGYWSHTIPVYELSSRISVHINQTNGMPVEFPDSVAGQVAALEFKSNIARSLQFDVLPVHIDVRYFATDFNVMGPNNMEEIEVTESFAITEI